MAATENPPWFHGRIDREETQARLRAAAARFTPGGSIFLIRRSGSSPQDFALCYIIAGIDEIKSFKISVTMQTGTTLYTLDLGPGKVAQPHFRSLEALVQHYQVPGTGLTVPLGAYVSPVAQPLAAPRPAQTATRPQPIPMESPAYTAPVANVANDALVAPSHPTLAPPMTAPDLAPHEKPETGLAGGKGGGVYRDPLARPDPNRPEELLAEGYLEKIRGVGQNRTRYFRLTNKKFSFYTKDSGDIIDSIDVDDISAVSDLSKTRLRVITKAPFGSSNSMEVVVEAPHHRVKERWLHAFKQESNTGGGFRSYEGELLAEGYLVKVQPVGTTSRTRWFALTDRHFAYYKEEGHDIMGSVPLQNITVVSLHGDKEFKIVSNERFTKTGSFEVLCRCETHAVRNKWLAQLHRALPSEKFQH